MDYKKHPSRLQRFVTLPVIYMVVLPLLFLDIVIEIYHRVCFWVYDLKYVVRSQYVVLDRHRLKKLNWRQKLHCVYCGYANGLLAYALEIANQTEVFWCGIKHDSKVKQRHQRNFDDYQDYM